MTTSYITPDYVWALSAHVGRLVYVKDQDLETRLARQRALVVAVYYFTTIGTK